MLHRLTRTAHSIHRAIRALWGALLDRLRQAWEMHRRLLRDNPAYAAAAAAGAATIAGQDSPLDLLAAIAAALLAIYAATRRSVSGW